MSESEQPADRRQRAREAFHDTFAGEYATSSDALDACIETATRVRVTSEIIEVSTQAAHAWSRSDDTSVDGGRRAVIIAAFRAAGFEVEE